PPFARRSRERAGDAPTGSTNTSHLHIDNCPTTMPSSSRGRARFRVMRCAVLRPKVPAAIRDKLGSDASEGLEVMFADAYTLANDSFERRLEIEAGKFRLAVAELRFEMVKWMFFFWAAELAAIGGMVFAVMK